MEDKTTYLTKIKDKTKVLLCYLFKLMIRLGSE